MPPTIQGLKKGDLKDRLDRLYLDINRPEFIAGDPVQFPHRYKKRQDREIAAFLAASIAWGRRDMILRSAEKMFSLMGPSPYAYVMEGNYQNLRDRPIGPSIHRTFFEEDLRYFCRGLRASYTRYGSLEALFASGPDLWEGISLFRETMAEGNSPLKGPGKRSLGKRSPGKGPPAKMAPGKAGKVAQPLYSRHIANPSAGSACKRLFLALRWLVRREGPVDMGLWKSISPAALFIPLDLHVGRSARLLGLLDEGRQANDRKAVISLTERLREFCPEDPIKYDFSLFGGALLGWNFQ